MIKLTRENEAITSFQHFKIWGFILTMRNVNWQVKTRLLQVQVGFILTMRNVNEMKSEIDVDYLAGFILTMRNVNYICSPQP